MRASRPSKTRKPSRRTASHPTPEGVGVITPKFYRRLGETSNTPWPLAEQNGLLSDLGLAGLKLADQIPIVGPLLMVAVFSGVPAGLKRDQVSFYEFGACMADVRSSQVGVIPNLLVGNSALVGPVVAEGE